MLNMLLCECTYLLASLHYSFLSCRHLSSFLPWFFSLSFLSLLFSLFSVLLLFLYFYHPRSFSTSFIFSSFIFLLDVRVLSATSTLLS